MKKWIFWPVHAMELIVVLVVVYFEPSCVIRGRLRGDATYQGLPTSHWRMKIDRWINQFGSPKAALSMMPRVRPRNDGSAAEVVEFIGGGLVVMRSATPWERLQRFFALDRDNAFVIIDPEILTHPVGGEDVLCELATEDRYRDIAERALDNARVLRALKEGKR